MGETTIFLIDLYDGIPSICYSKYYTLYSNQLLRLLYYAFNGSALVLLIIDGIVVALQRPSPATDLTTSLLL
jgi:hypothetical protein